MNASTTIYLYDKVLFHVNCSLHSENSLYFVELAPIDDGIRSVSVSLPVTERVVGKKTAKIYRGIACTQLLEKLRAQVPEDQSVESWLLSRKAESVQRKKLHSAEYRNNCTPWTSIVPLSALIVKHNVEVDFAVALDGVLVVDVEFVPDSRPRGLSVVSFFDGINVYVFTKRFLVEFPSMRKRVAEYLKAHSVLVFCDTRQDLPVLRHFFGVDYEELSHDVQRCEPDFADNTRCSLQNLFNKYCAADGKRYAKDEETSVSFQDVAGTLSSEQLRYCCADAYATHLVHLQQTSSK
ncbi:hypothetical protein CYMTET_44588 [Cymbomonas tetramitiformis]|uniref:3'-5' exonuclease domain-containing protein n=1 Tax=Cymbomonas tetramitiformis TaxID=36881 RepID=A0AAE0EZD1_9CHLO|nr:hypothetical protein CYMTET_44588 [Cymbomonas tetramitiformis]